MDAISLSSIRISSDSIAELDGSRTSISIPRQDIINISLKYGSTSERPIAQFMVSVILVGLGLYLGVYPLADMIVRGNYFSNLQSFKLFAYAVPLILLGGYYLNRLFIKRFYLLVYTNNDKRRLVFNDKLTEGEVQTFIMNCNNSLRYGVKIEEKR
jgi:hypothetical protein